MPSNKETNQSLPTDNYFFHQMQSFSADLQIHNIEKFPDSKSKEHFVWALCRWCLEYVDCILWED